MRERPGFDPWVRKIPWRRKRQATPVLLPGKSHGWSSLVGYGPWGHKELDTTEQLHLFHSVWQSLSPFKSLLMTQFHSFYGWVIAHCRRRRWHPTPVLLPGKSHGWSSLVGCNPWGCKELDTTEQPHFHFSVSCIQEGNGNPLQYFCLENPMDGAAWWAAVHGVTKGRTRLSDFTFTSLQYNHQLNQIIKHL